MTLQAILVFIALTISAFCFYLEQTSLVLAQEPVTGLGRLLYSRISDVPAKLTDKQNAVLKKNSALLTQVCVTLFFITEISLILFVRVFST